MEPTPPAPDPARKSGSEQDTLRTLALFHYVLAALGALFGGFFLLYAAFGGLLLRRPDLFVEGGKQGRAKRFFPARQRHGLLLLAGHVPARRHSAQIVGHILIHPCTHHIAERDFLVSKLKIHAVPPFQSVI